MPEARSHTTSASPMPWARGELGDPLPRELGVGQVVPAGESSASSAPASDGPARPGP